MKTKIYFSPLGLMLWAACVAIFLPACRKKPLEQESKRQIEIAPVLHSNQLGSLPGVLYREYSKSPIRWQLWGTDVLKHAKAANRLVLVVVTSSHQSVTNGLLNELFSDPRVARDIELNYIPVFVDLDTAREMGPLVSVLSSETGKPTNLPFLMWLSPDGNPVAWTAIVALADQQVSQIYMKSSDTLSKMWEQSPEYMVNNSRLDNERRRLRLTGLGSQELYSDDPGADTLDAIRGVVALYDDVTHSFDGVGGLFPSGVLALVAQAARHPGMPADRRAEYGKVIRDFIALMITTPMFDPLDGGMFTQRLGNSGWALPVPNKECSAQARMALSLIACASLNHDPRLEAGILGIVKHLELRYRLDSGLFAEGVGMPNVQKSILWEESEIQKLLDEREFAVWKIVSNISKVGNLPLEVDLQREYFRLNSLALMTPVDDAATRLGISTEQVKAAFESGRVKLLEARKSKGYVESSDTIANAEASFRMVSLYASLFGMTGDEVWRDKCLSLLAKCKETFFRYQVLKAYDTDLPPSIGDARAMLYGLAMQAALDAHQISMNPEWLDWTKDLAGIATIEFAEDDGLLMECPKASRVLDLPITDSVMIFGDSTVGVFSMVDTRLDQLGNPMVARLSEIVRRLPKRAKETPIIFTDTLEAWLHRTLPLRIVFASDIPETMKSHILRQAPRMVTRSLAQPGDGVAPATARVFKPNGTQVDVSSLHELKQALLPSR